MKIVVIFAGITYGPSTSSVFKPKGRRNVLHCWPDHKRFIIDPLVKAGHEVSVRFSTYLFSDENFKNKFFEIINPDRMIVAPFEGSCAYTTKFNSFKLIEPDEPVDFVIWTRADQHMHVPITSLNIDFKKFNFLFKEVAPEPGGVDWWERARFTPDCLWMWPGHMTAQVAQSFVNSFDWNRSDHSAEDPYHRNRSDSHCLYNYLPKSDVHFIDPGKFSAGGGNPYLRHCWDDLSEFSY
jgi:hypothetical protein